MTNIVPQSNENNAGAWNQLELYARSLVTDKGKKHIPSDLVVDRRTAYIECSSALDFPLRHEAHAQDLL
jgi:DNA/RNA endonuclease G (NUC1)